MRTAADSRYLFRGVVERPSKLPFDECIALSSSLSQMPMIGHEGTGEVARMVPADVVSVLGAHKIDFMLVGAHGVSGWMMQPRATQDVVLLVGVREKAKAARSIGDAFPDLEVEKFPQVWRFGKRGAVLLDLMFADSPLHKRVIKEFEFTQVTGIRVKIPKLECALAMKFAAMTGHYRNLAKKYQDASDFISMVEKNKKLNVVLLSELGELQYSGGGAELLKYVDEARAGKRMLI